MNAPALADLAPGFEDPVHDAQAAFRRLLDAMSRPGRVQKLAPAAAPAGLSAATAAVLLSVADPDVTVWLAPTAHVEAQAAWLRFHTGARVATSAAQADWLVLHADAAHADLWRMARTGTDEAPHTAATLLVDVPSLAMAPGLTLRGPGIADRHILAVGGIARPFWGARIAQEPLFPRGADLVLACGTHVAALPRSTRITLED